MEEGRKQHVSLAAAPSHFTIVCPVLSLGHRKMEVFFPKFKLNQRYEMHELLKQMGIRRLFSTSADLSELSAVAGNLQVSKASQRPCSGPVRSM